MLTEWSWEEHEPIVRAKLQQLLTYRLHVTPDFGALANDYRAVLEAYLIERSSRRLAGKEPSARPVKSLVNRTAEALAALDERRSTLFSRALEAPPKAEEVTLTRQ